MGDLNVFVSVGATANDEQESFVRAIEDRLRSEGLTPHTVGRNSFSDKSPLTAVTELMDRCSGTVVIALERMYCSEGIEKRNGKSESRVADVKLATPWNQIEAAMAYSRGHPLMVIVEAGVRNEGLLQYGYDWFVQSVQVDASVLSKPEFNGVLSSWKQKLKASSNQSHLDKSPAELTVGQLITRMKLSHLWATLAALVTLTTGAFMLGAKFFAS
ncbi:hypothetical protein EDP1_3006 [Pseudomonas putida S610]|uniref:hypothetical protein n=1 Tax=Pseudomonas putida group TaxID=136845 RepID=UPI0003C5B27D|nr:hypothetical protein [Pseudomonas putida]EST14124.1 hypothetical protein EDP1_3006 [Pseudomonas putida S610]